MKKYVRAAVLLLLLGVIPSMVLSAGFGEEKCFVSTTITNQLKSGKPLNMVIRDLLVLEGMNHQQIVEQLKCNKTPQRDIREAAKTNGISDDTIDAVYDINKKTI